MDQLSDSRQAGATAEIEITSAMAEAGALVYRLAHFGGDPCDGGLELAADVFSAMIEAQESPPLARQPQQFRPHWR